MYICHRKIMALAAVLAVAGPLAAQVQQLRFEPIIVSAAPASTLDFELRYATDPPSTALTGLGLRLHWDSSQVSLDAFTPAVDQALLGQNAAEDDTLDFDANPDTDRFAVIAWADPAARWPGFADGVLGTATVTLAPGFSGVTTLGLSSTSTPAGWTLSDIPATITDPDIGVPAPELALEKRWLSLDGRPGIDFGDEAFFEIEVTNPGLVGIDAVAVTDPLAPDCDRSNVRLLAGESRTWQCSQADVVASFVNQAVATGTALDNAATPVAASASAEVTVLDPLLAVVIDPPTQLVRTGAAAGFEISIRNDSDQALDEIEITSLQVPACDLALDTLDAGAATTWTCQHVDVARDFVNRLEATAMRGEPPAPTLLNQVSAEVRAIDPAIELAFEADPETVEIGAPVEFTLRLTNTGNSGLSGLGVSVADQAGCDRQFSTLASGATLEWSCARDAVQGSFTLAATAVASPPVGDPVTDTTQLSIEAFKLVFRDGFETTP
ncbi:MAG TPA: hypothetical protein VKO85_07375 [Wenzhouxiangellaceae bacterium]|nr:hypothetical protein [Wenzhouxiangellaceae bacterium]